MGSPPGDPRPGRGPGDQGGAAQVAAAGGREHAVRPRYPPAGLPRRRPGCARRGLRGPAGLGHDLGGVPEAEDVVAGVDVQDLSRDVAPHVAAQEDDGVPGVLDVDVPAQGGHLGGELLHAHKAGDAPGGHGAQGAEREQIDPDVVRPQLGGQVAPDAVQGGLGHPHDLVAQDDLLPPQVGHGGDAPAPALAEEGLRGAGERQQAVGAAVHGHVEVFQGGVREAVREGGGGGVGHGVDEEVQPPQLRLQALEHGVDLGRVGGVLQVQQDGPRLPGDEVGGLLGVARLVGVRQARPFAQAGLGDAPGDAVLVGEPGDQAELPFEQSGHASVSCRVSSSCRVRVG